MPFSSPMSISAAPRNTAVSIEKDSTLSLLLKQTPKQVSLLLGRKLSFKEKVGLKMLKWKIAKIPPDDRVVTRAGQRCPAVWHISRCQFNHISVGGYPTWHISYREGIKGAERQSERCCCPHGKDTWHRKSWHPGIGHIAAHCIYLCVHH